MPLPYKPTGKVFVLLYAPANPKPKINHRSVMQSVSHSVYMGRRNTIFRPERRNMIFRPSLILYSEYPMKIRLDFFNIQYIVYVCPTVLYILFSEYIIDDWTKLFGRTLLLSYKYPEIVLYIVYLYWKLNKSSWTYSTAILSTLVQEVFYILYYSDHTITVLFFI